MDNQQGPTVQHRELSSIVCDSLDGRGVWRRMDTWICMADSLWYSPETVTALLIGYAPIQNKKLKKYLLYQGLYKDDEKTNYRLGENICKHPNKSLIRYLEHTNNSHNKEAKKNTKQFNLKMGQRNRLTFP